ncbi:cytochrome-b5 reductase [Coprinellus micaceus]|uniref:NADH-cytochrome b5 reductase n=1 Tax=Coprinellus micaceus TaxID=71717 RepID=A0A4Y7TWP6_COPMI|nr:cytochrome-b5 reductase [Coprinellus micaceus]
MSFLRAAVATRSIVAQAGRRYASTSPAAPRKSGYAGYFLAVGTAGAAGYAYLEMRERYSPKPQEKSPLDPENWKDFKLKKINHYNHNTSEFVFELPNNEASLIPITSCLLVKASNPEALSDAKGRPIVRPYTPVSSPDQKGELTLLVKKYDEGKASKHIHELKEGDTLSFKGPIVKFPYKANEFDEVALIGGGSGITPLYQLVVHALADKGNKTKFKLLFANVTEKDILLREEFDALKKKYPSTFDVVYFLDQAPEGWTGPTGYINADAIKAHVGAADLKEKVKVFVCGPPGQVAAVAGKKAGMKQGELGGILKELGYTEDQVRLSFPLRLVSVSSIFCFRFLRVLA